MAGNLEKLKQLIGTEKRPFIVYDVETTGAMNGNDNRITQIALASYAFENGEYQLQDKIFMLAKGDKENLVAIQAKEVVNEANITDKAYSEYSYKAKKANQPVGSRESSEFSVFLTQNHDRIQREMTEAVKLEEVLKLQGLDIQTYGKGQDGLTFSECQVGITEFLKTYQQSNTVFVNNGTYFAKHYLDKAGLVLGNDVDRTIDLTQAERSLKGGVGRWTADFSTFAKNYLADTGKEIKTFDALTKAMCMAEMVSKATRISLTHSSANYLKQAVSESAFSQDKDYVMSLSRASSLHWIPALSYEYNDRDYHFDALEYVDFGNDRRYVDLDKMFEVNDNFEITLEGTKEPIKTWEELEAKIKALNAEVSSDLLNKIHEKYDEIRNKAEEQKSVKEQEVKEVKPSLQFEETIKRLSSCMERMEALNRDVADKKTTLERTEQNVNAIYDAKMNDFRKMVQPLLDRYQKLKPSSPVIYMTRTSICVNEPFYINAEGRLTREGLTPDAKALALANFDQNSQMALTDLCEVFEKTMRDMQKTADKYDEKLKLYADIDKEMDNDEYDCPELE